MLSVDYNVYFLSIVTVPSATWWQRWDMSNPIPITPPQPFDFKKPDEWVKWKRRFEQLLCASGLDKEDETRLVSTLLYCLGEEADGVLASTNIAEEARKKYKDVMTKFDEYFKVRKNLILERARFNKRDQRDRGTVRRQRNISLPCTSWSRIASTVISVRKYILRDRLVVGIRDERLSEKLQLEADLTLEKTKRKLSSSNVNC